MANWFAFVVLNAILACLGLLGPAVIFIIYIVCQHHARKERKNNANSRKLQSRETNQDAGHR